MEPESVTLYYRDPDSNSDKVYQASIEQSVGGFVVNFAFGRRGSTLQTGTKTQSAVAYDKAKSIFDKLVREKQAKGYTTGMDGTPYLHTDNEQRDTGLRPQLLNEADEAEIERLILNDGWYAQEKKDGKRVLLRKQGEEITGINRKGLSIGLPETVVQEARSVGGEFVMDGECVGDVIHVFDLLEQGGTDLRGLPYSERLRELAMLLKIPRNGIQLIKTAPTAKEKRDLIERLKREGKEGIVFKRHDAPYKVGRPNSGGTQLKHKFYKTASFIVAKINQKRSVALELFEGKNRVVVGNVTIPANASVPKAGTVAEVRYLYCFKGGSLFQPSFLGVRDDIDPKQCSVRQLKYRAADEDDEA